MYELIINLRNSDKRLSLDCKTPNTVAMKAKIIREEGVIDNEGTKYQPSDILSTVCSDLLPNK